MRDQLNKLLLPQLIPPESSPLMPWFDPLQVLLAAMQLPWGLPTVTEEDQLLSVGDVTATEVAARPLPDQMKDTSGDDTPNEKDDVKLTSEDVGDDMEDI